MDGLYKRGEGELGKLGFGYLGVRRGNECSGKEDEMVVIFSIFFISYHTAPASDFVSWVTPGSVTRFCMTRPYFSLLPRFFLIACFSFLLSF
ncbi:hypothetical protein Hanom_Chr04g00351851 [Helianthus anomalus]